MGKTMGETELTEVAGFIKHETERAILLSDGLIADWIPKSQCQENGDGTFTMPLWLAKEKGFI